MLSNTAEASDGKTDVLRDECQEMSDLRSLDLAFNTMCSVAPQLMRESEESVSMPQFYAVEWCCVVHCWPFGFFPGKLLVAQYYR